MRVTWKDIAATVLVAAIVVPYVGYLARGEMPFIDNPRAMAGVALILGLVASFFAGSAVRGSETMLKAASVAGAAALALGVAAGITENELLLGGFIAAIVLMWLLATVRHAIYGRAQTGS